MRPDTTNAPRMGLGAVLFRVLATALSRGSAVGMRSTRPHLRESFRQAR